MGKKNDKTKQDRYKFYQGSYTLTHSPQGFCKVFLPRYRINDLLAII